jgi:hypothetical protein
MNSSNLSKEEKNNKDHKESAVIIPFHLMDKDGKICSGEIVEINENNELKPVLHIDDECEITLDNNDRLHIIKEFELQKKALTIGK